MAAQQKKADHILDAAEALARIRGYNGFSFRDVADEVGIKSASVHYHFPTKGALGVALAHRYTDRFIGKLDERPDDTPALDHYVDVCRAALVEENKMCLCGMLAAEIASLPTEVEPEIKRFFEKHADWLTDALKAIGPERAASAQEDALALVAAMEGAMLVARGTHDVAAFDRVVNVLRRTGLLPAA